MRLVVPPWGMKDDGRRSSKRPRAKMDPELINFVKTNQRSNLHLESLLEAPQDACMLLKGLHELLWQDGCEGGEEEEETSRLAFSMVRDTMYALHPEFLAMVTSVAVASEGEELFQLRLLTPMMENLFDRCLEFANFFEHQYEYLEVAEVPDILLEYTLFSRAEVDLGISSFGDIGDPCDKISFVNQIFYGFLDMIDNYIETYQKVASLYEKITWSSSTEDET